MHSNGALRLNRSDGLPLTFARELALNSIASARAYAKALLPVFLSQCWRGREHAIPIAGGLLLLFPFLFCAEAQSVPIWQMQHSSWRGHDGAPQGVDALGEAPDGSIWIASPGRLTRFDGIHFDRYSLPASIGNDPNGMRAAQMIAAANGDLWMFRTHGTPLVLRNGRLTESLPVDDPHLGNTWLPFKDPEGRLFALQDDSRIVELAGGDTWRETERYRVSGSFLSDAAIGPDHVAWVVKNQMLLRVRPGAAEADDVGFAVGFDSQIVPLSDHTLWIMSRSAPSAVRGRRLYSLRHIDENAHLVAPPLMVEGIDFILPTRNGELWVTAQNRGTWKLPAFVKSTKGKLLDERPLTLQEGGDFVSSASGPMLEGQDGSIWIGGNMGLDNFRQARLVPALSTMHSGLWTLCVTPRSDVWIADDVQTLVRLRGIQSLPLKGYQSNGLGAHLACGNDGTVWLAAGSRVMELSEHQAQTMPRLPGTERGYLGFDGVTYANGRLTVSVIVGSQFTPQLWTRELGHWTRELATTSLPRVMGLFRDDDGALYISFRDGSLKVLKDGVLEPLDTLGHNVGILYGFNRTSYGLIGFGRNGIFLIKERVYVKAPKEDVYDVTGVVDDEGRDLWLTGSNGIVDLPAADVQKFIKDKSSPVRTLRVAEGDFLGPDDPISGRSSAWRDASGRLWFSTLQGIVSLDSSTIFANAGLPRLGIQEITSRGIQMKANRQFPPGTSDINIQYLGIFLSSPRSVTYRYRLVGAENTWHDAGDQTEATYAHLRFGVYRFEVVASNGLGTWTAPVRSELFYILPHFWQTWWFLSLSLLTSGYAIRLLFQQRLRDARVRARMLADERAEERSRIARELHDTLLQGVQGLLLAFEAVRNRLLQGGDVLPLLDSSLSATEALVVEGRERIATIRKNAPIEDALPKRLRALCSNLNNESPTPITLTMTGTARELHADVSEELYFVARESIRNALKHSGAAKVEVTLRYNKRLFRVDIVDNGLGFDLSKELLETSLRANWGLQGMRERAESIHAQLRILSQVGLGTQVIVRVDSKYAYRE